MYVESRTFGRRTRFAFCRQIDGARNGGARGRDASCQNPPGVDPSWCKHACLRLLAVVPAGRAASRGVIAQ